MDNQRNLDLVTGAFGFIAVTTWGYLVEQADEQDGEAGVQHVVHCDEPVLVGCLQQSGNCRTW